MNKIFMGLAGVSVLLLSFIGGVIVEDTKNIFDESSGFIFEQPVHNTEPRNTKDKNEENEEDENTTTSLFPWLLGGNSSGLLSASEQKDLLEKISLKKPNEVYSLLSKYYIDPEKIDPEKIEEGLIRGVLYALDDPYTQFFNDEQSEEFKQSMQGDFEGIGAVLEKQSGALTISEVLKGRPAADSGLLPGDIILTVDGEELGDESIYDTVLRIRGEKGTVVTLEIFRPTKSKKIKIPVTRATIHVESVTLEWKGKDADIAVFEISQFGDEMVAEFTKVFTQASMKKAKGVIIDLRYNGGGYLTGAIDLASFFLPEKTTVVTIKKRGEEDQEGDISYTTNIGFQMKDIPLLVLVNGGSASASEIFAGAIQDAKRGKILGEKTFGKGSVQQIFPLSNPAEEVKITIAKWFTPSGKSPTNEVPIIPEIIVEFDRTEMTDQQREQKWDPQLDAAVEELE